MTSSPQASGRTNAGGNWSAALSGRDRHAFGDDRDVVIVTYGRGGPLPDLIATGSGGNPFTESGWTGFFDLDNGYAVADRGVLLSPCSQTGVLGLTIGGKSTGPPVEQCETETDVAPVPTGPITARTQLTMSSEDNRGNSAGQSQRRAREADDPARRARQRLGARQPAVLFNPTGFPQCTANLEAQSVLCTGLVPGSRYTFIRRRGDRVAHARAPTSPAPRRIARAGVTGGDVITLRNSAGRTLTTLHVAHLRVHVIDQQTVLSGGTCEPGDYYGKPITAPTERPVGRLRRAAGTGLVCPDDGRAAGLPAGIIEQTDDFSGGLTRTELVGVASLSPNNGATLYGAFVASAQPALFGFNDSIYDAPATVSLSVKRLGAKHRTMFVRNVAVGHGVKINALPPGVYAATWVVTNVNGDTVTVHTRFVEARLSAWSPSLRRRTRCPDSETATRSRPGRSAARPARRRRLAQVAPSLQAA